MSKPTSKDLDAAVGCQVVHGNHVVHGKEHVLAGGHESRACDLLLDHEGGHPWNVDGREPRGERHEERKCEVIAPLHALEHQRFDVHGEKVCKQTSLGLHGYTYIRIVYSDTFAYT